MKLTPQEAQKLIIAGNAPDGIVVNGNLYLEGTGITILPDNLQVNENLYIWGTGITSLPDDLKVGGGLCLKHTGITSLPDDLKVNGNLYLEGTGIISLPDDLQVGGYLNLVNTGIKAVYEDHRGFKLYPIPKTTGEIRWCYGSRFFQSTEEALSHWGSKAGGQGFCRAIKEYEEKYNRK